MLQIRKAADRGPAEFGWLSSRHSFSFGHYHDPAHMEFGPLRVLNEDTVQPGMGFGTHAHRDMEIISYVLDGALEHKDSLGTGSVIRHGDVQRMSAGTGVQHSEFNHSRSETVHFLQVWIIPARNGIAPSYEEKHFDDASKRGRLRLIASGDARDGSVHVHQDVAVFASILDGAQRIEHPLAAGRLGYVHVARGALTVNGIALEAGDALKFIDESGIVLESASNAEIMLFDLPR